MKQSDEDDSNYSDTDYAIHMKDTYETTARKCNHKESAKPKELVKTTSIRKNKSTDLFATDRPAAPMYRNSSFQQGRRATIFDSLNDEFIESDSRANLLNFKEADNNKSSFNASKKKLLTFYLRKKLNIQFG
jgi:hypothetical protein